jgi:hypothetical protein
MGQHDAGEAVAVVPDGVRAKNIRGKNFSTRMFLQVARSTTRRTGQDERIGRGTKRRWCAVWITKAGGSEVP